VQGTFRLGELRGCVGDADSTGSAYAPDDVGHDSKHVKQLTDKKE